MTDLSDARRSGILAIVPARGGSKGLPGKNIRPLDGHPLIAWSIAAGQAASTVERVLCSTDDEAIAETARRYGAEVPFLRPAAFATDGATDLDVFAHALEWLEAEQGYRPELVVQLRPTTPFRQAAWIDDAVGKMLANPAISCVRSIAPAPHTPYKMWRRTGQGDRLAPLLTLDGCAEPFNMPRQALPMVYWHTGQLDVIRAQCILDGSMTGEEIHAIDVPAETAVDIDTLIDFRLAELSIDTCQSPEIRDRLDAR